ncbi:class I SAM-dependent methyltransferase [Methylocystis echinoides]|uniref:class I SAM-dependent methyltransferase n=1 Tax=Methylocystis echinoides TaxID=29468 RepID=UPI00341FFCE7
MQTAQPLPSPAIPNVAETLRLLTEAEIRRMFGMGLFPCDGANLDAVAPLAAAIDTAIFVSQHLPETPAFVDSGALLDEAMRRREVEGLVLEFGVFSGRTINRLAAQTPQKIYGFDSFEGLPEDWRPDVGKGSFRAGLPAVAANVELVVGWFDRTLPDFLARNEGPASLIHIDCDLYSSTKTVFDCCADRIVPGTILVFDEFFNYVGWRRHEFRAFTEFAEKAKIDFDYIGYVPSHQQAAVRVRATGRQSAPVKSRGGRKRAA